MKTPDLRNWQPSASDAKHVDDTPMLNTTAREPAANISDTNKIVEEVNDGPDFGPLGAKGRH